MEQFQKVSGRGRCLIAGIIVSSGLLLVGCESKNTVVSLASTPAVIDTLPQPVKEPQPEVKSNRIGLCRSELASLKSISSRAYAARKAEFDNLVRTASVYTSVRGDVNLLTKDTLDALYKYKTNRLCAEIERDVLNGLIRRGENVK